MEIQQIASAICGVFAHILGQSVSDPQGKPLEPQVLAAIISGAFAIVVAAQTWFLHWKLEKQQKIVGILADEQAQSRGRRREALEALFNSASISKSAAHHLLDGVAIRNEERRLNETAQAMQKLATFFTEAHKAEDNIRLNREDLGHIVQVRTALVRLFLRVDLDAEGTEYESRLSESLDSFNKAFSTFEDYVRTATTA